MTSRFVATDLPVETRIEWCRGHLESGGEHLSRLSKVITGLQCADIDGGDLRQALLLLEVPLEMIDRRFERTLVEPVGHPERVHVPAAVDVLGTHAAFGQRLAGQATDGDPEELVPPLDLLVVEWIRLLGVTGLLEINLVEFIIICDDDPTGFNILNVHLERSGIHGDHRVDRITRRVNVVTGELDLESRHAEGGPLRSSDFRGEVWKCREVVADHRGGVRELPTGQLHAVTRVATEANGDRFLEIKEVLD